MMAIITSCVTTQPDVYQAWVDILAKPKRNRNLSGDPRHFGKTKFDT